MSEDDLENLAVAACTCLVRREPITMTHAPGWQRPVNWPLPKTRAKPAADGSLTQDYRPLAILEYVGWALGELEKEEPLW